MVPRRRDRPGRDLVLGPLDARQRGAEPRQEAGQLGEEQAPPLAPPPGGEGQQQPCEEGGAVMARRHR